MKCKICASPSDEIFTTQVLKKYPVKYYQCQKCRFIQTQEVFWLQEAYQSAITDLDIGLVNRNIYYSKIVSRLIDKYFDASAKFIDYGGGYGMFVRLMRDEGYDFYRYDLYCQNLFAKYFDSTDLPAGQRYSVLTAFEVFEHLDDPLAEVKTMLSFSDTIVFSTELQPQEQLNPDNWWYFIPETGQHIALYSAESLAYMARQLGVNFYSYGAFHVFSPLREIELKKVVRPITLGKVTSKLEQLFRGSNGKRASLLERDFNYIKSRL